MFLLSVYAPDLGDINCDGDCSTMANMQEPYEGALACPMWLPLGTVIELDHTPVGHGFFTCSDRGGMVTDNKLDFCITGDNLLERAMDWGRRLVHGVIHNWNPPPEECIVAGRCGRSICPQH